MLQRHVLSLRYGFRLWIRMNVKFPQARKFVLLILNQKVSTMNDDSKFFHKGIRRRKSVTTSVVQCHI